MKRTIKTVKKERNDLAFATTVTELLPVPKYSVVLEGKEVFPMWISRKKSFEWALQRLGANSNKAKVQLATPEFQEYYKKIQKKKSNYNLGIKDDELDNLQYERTTDYHFPYLSERIVFACPDCGQVSYEVLDVDRSTEDITSVMDAYGTTDGMLVLHGEGLLNYNRTYVCPNCNKEISKLTFTSGNSLVPRTMTMFEDEDKIICSGFINSFYLNPKAKRIGMSAFRTRVVFNTRTGQTYALPAMDMNGKKLTKKWISHITNCTYTGCVCDNALYAQWKEKSFQKAIVKELLIKQGNEEATDEWFEAIDELNDKGTYSTDVYQIMSVISLLNRFPMLDAKSIVSFSKTLKSHCLYKNITSIFGGIKTTNTAAEFTSLVKVNMPKTKAFKRLIAEDTANAFKLKVFYAYGFRKIDLMARFCSIDQASVIWPENDYSGTFNQKKKFVKKLIAERGDVVAMNLLCSNHNHFFTDTAMMYEKLLPHNVISKNDLKGNLKEIHDNFSRLINRIKFANTPIKYSEKEIKRYNMQINNLSFKLATDTHELIRVGQDMHICVGGYGDRAVSRDCTIVVARDEKDIPRICIELNHSGKKLRQAKAIYNNRPQANLAVALKEWLEKTSVDDDGCYDYQHIKEGNIEFDESKCYTSRSDFHNLEIDENGDVVTAAERRRAANNANDNVFVEDNDFEF